MKKLNKNTQIKCLDKCIPLLEGLVHSYLYFFNLSPLSDEIRDEEQRVENLKQKSVSFDSYCYCHFVIYKYYMVECLYSPKNSIGYFRYNICNIRYLLYIKQ